MPVSHPDKLNYLFNDEPLGAEYDEQADILYLWRGDPTGDLLLTTAEGHLVRIDPETAEIVGFTIFDFCSRWQAEDFRPIGRSRSTSPASTSVKASNADRSAPRLELGPGLAFAALLLGRPSRLASGEAMSSDAYRKIPGR